MLAQQMKGVVRFNSKDLSRIRLFQKQKKQPKQELNIGTKLSSAQNHRTVDAIGSKARYDDPNPAQPDHKKDQQEILEEDGAHALKEAKATSGYKKAGLAVRSARQNE